MEHTLTWQYHFKKLLIIFVLLLSPFVPKAQIDMVSNKTAVDTLISVNPPASDTIVVESHLKLLNGYTGDNDTSLWKLDSPNIYYEPGNVGVGTTDPDALLHVAGNIGLLNASSVRVDEIEILLTDDDTNIPTSGAVVDYVTAQITSQSWDYEIPTDGMTVFTVPFTLLSSSLVFFNGDILLSNQWSGIGSTSLTLALSPTQHDFININK